jgi:hypothetical protein
MGLKGKGKGEEKIDTLHLLSPSKNALLEVGW